MHPEARIGRSACLRTTLTKGITTMILFLTTNQKTNLLDFLKLDGVELPIKKMVGSFNLQRFIVSDMRNFSHLTEVIFERTAFDDTDSEFVEAIEEFMTMYSARVSVIYEGLDTDSTIFRNLLGIGVGNLIVSTDIYEIQSEITECMSESGMQRYNVKERVKPRNTGDHYHFECQNIRIGVIGSQERIGVTTTAVGLASWLVKVGATACYIEANKQKRLQHIAMEYGEEITDNRFSANNIDFMSAEPTDEYNFKVYDIGTTANMDLIEGMDIVLVMCGIKMYELPYTAKVLKQLERTYAYICPLFLAEDRREDFIHLFQTEFYTPLYIEYQPDFTDSTPNKKNYKLMIQRYIATV